jgi:hypothetical protein
VQDIIKPVAEKLLDGRGKFNNRRPTGVNQAPEWRDEDI